MHTNRRKNAPRIPHDTGLSPSVLGRWLPWHGHWLLWHGPTGPCRAHKARPNHPPRCSCPALHVLALLLTLLLPNTSHAQTPTPTPEDALTAFHIADRYIRNWSVPATPITKDSDPKQNPRAVGVCLTLKLRGEVIARGVAWSDSIAGPDALDPDLIRKAALAAIQQGEGKLGVPNDAMRDESIKQVTKDIAISIELAGPLSAVEFTTWDDAELTLRPGLDGVAARIRIEGASGVSQRSTPSGPLQAIFPSQMMLNNMLPHRAMAAAVSKTLGEGGAAAALEDPKKLREQSAVRMYRFRVAHAAQASAGVSPVILYRGERLLPAAQTISIQELQEIADRCAAHLAIIFPRGNRGHTQPVATSSPESLLSELAMSEYFKVRGSAVVDPGFVIQSSNEVLPNGKSLSPVVLAFRFVGVEDFWLSMGKPKYIDPQAVMLKQSYPMLDVLFDRQGKFFGEIPPTARGLVAMALVCRAEAVHKPNFGHEWTATEKEHCLRNAEESVRALMTPSAEAGFVSQMPWLGLAELRLAQLKHTIDPSISTDIPSALALRRMREQVWKHQLSATDVTEDTLDMAGGIVFTSGLGDGGGHANPYPTWQCVRPLAFIATMLGDPRLTEANERPTQIAHLMQAMRFLRQLQVDEAASWMYPDPKAAIGGIRAATWDNSQPSDATSLTLLCVVELLKSLDEISKPAAPAAEKPDK